MKSVQNALTSHQYLDGIPSNAAEAHNQRVIPQHFKVAVVLAPVSTTEIRQLTAKPSTAFTRIFVGSSVLKSKGLSVGGLCQANCSS